MSVDREVNRTNYSVSEYTAEREWIVVQGINKDLKRST